MFCKWCGKRIKNTAKSCPLCGREQESLFNGNGFWDLCNVKDEKRLSLFQRKMYRLKKIW